MERKILHIDVNNAFLSWTAVHMLKNGSEIDIRTIPAIIGGDESKRRGIVLAKSMKAKEFGIVTAEPIYFAKQKCPSLKIFPGNHPLYEQYSDELYNLLLEYTDEIERFSIDECFLDMTHYLMGSTLEEKAEEIHKRVKEELGFTVNIGISENKLLAKMASDFEKPDKIHSLYRHEIKDKIWHLQINELFMLGKKSVPKLYNMNIKTIGDLANTDVNILNKRFGKFGQMIWEYSNGIDNSAVNYKHELPKGIGHSITLPMDVSNIEKLNEILLGLVEQTTYRLRKYNLLANVVSVQIKTNKFQMYSHQRKLGNATSNNKDIYIQAKELLKEMYKGELVRLVGVRVDNLVGEDEVQLSIFDSNNKRNEKLDKALDSIKDRYGYSSIKKARELNIDKYDK